MTTTSSKLKLPPAVKGNWLFGSGFNFALDPIGFLTKNGKDQGGIYLVPSRAKNIMVVQDPDLVKYMLQDNNKNFIKSFGYDVLAMLLGKGLLTSEGDFWRKQRRMAQPAFHKERLNAMVNSMVRCTQEYMEKLEAKRGQEVDLSKEMSHVTLHIVATSLFSSNVEDVVDTVAREMDIAQELAIKRISNPFKLPVWIPTPGNLKERKSIARLDKVMLDIIEKRRKDPNKYDDLLQMLMEVKDEDTGEQMDDRQLRDECMTIFLAGHETTALALTWLWYTLDKNPSEIDKLRAEAKAVLQGNLPQVDDVMKLEYTRMAIDEGMRLYPPAWAIGRRTVEEDEIGGYRVPKGYNLIIPVYHIHHDPKIWDNPEGFNPERFRKGNLKDKHRFAYFPFGGGPRLCIGNNFALMEMQIVVAMMVTKFRFKHVDGHKVVLDPLITLRAKHGMMVTVE